MENISNAINSERATIGTLLLGDRRHATEIFTNLTVDDFSDPVCRVAFPHFKALYEKNIPVDESLVVDAIIESGKINKAVTISDICNLEQWVMRPDNVGYHIKRVIAASRERTAQKIIADAASGGGMALARLQTLSGAAEKLVMADSEVRGGLMRGEDAIQKTFLDYITNLEKPQNRISTGFKMLDRIIGGFFPGSLYIIAARPSVGKSAGAAQIGRHCRNNGHHTFDLSLEMDSDSLIRRDACAISGIDARDLRDNRLTQSGLERLQKTMGEMREQWAGIYTICDKLDGNPERIAAQIEIANGMASKPVGLLIVDYLQLMSIKGGKFQNRQEEVATISRGLKCIAREFNIPVIALSQMNREVESRAGEKGAKASSSRPRLSDLKESGAIEQDADVVMFLHRTYRARDGTDEMDMIDLIIAKQRNGPLGEVPLYFQGKHVRFFEREDNEYGR